ncbi:DUF1476 domain-containing protein [Rhodoblastus sp.]|uniref:DUF1476 domain-containing protein n=1 Tax=Rhodoblastus sp. TaxID=1962975 RepID=UPI003F994E2A
MSTFDKREVAFENRFAHDEEILFKALARAKYMLGIWAAEQLHKSVEAAANYAQALVANDIASPAANCALAEIHKDFMAAGVAQSEHQIARHYEEFRVLALQQLTRA